MSSPNTMSAAWVVALLSMMLGLQPITTDLYLPALPMLTNELQGSVAQAQLTLSALLLAFGMSQLVWGPLSDRFGRRTILLIGLGAYTVAAAGAMLSQSMVQLIVWRVVQGVAMGATIMSARAIVRDLYEPLVGARVISQALSGLGVMACLSGPLGGFLAGTFGWHVTLLALVVFAAVLLGLVVWKFEETLAQPNPQALALGQLTRTWWHIIKHPTFLTYSLLGSASYAGLFTFLAASSFVFIGILGFSQHEYGLVMFSMPLSYIIGTVACRRLIPRLGLERTMGLGSFLSLVAGSLMAGLAWQGQQSLWSIMVPFYLFMFAHGINQPCTQSASVGPFPQAAGTASALNGFMMMLVAFGMSTWLGQAMDGTVKPLAYGVGAWSVVIAVIAALTLKRLAVARSLAT
jgi:DHA1 family bicyclomycin/chloramphenicol resistance-like MFS transporter